MRCPRCEADTPDVAKVCIECGASLKLRCPQCRSDVLPRAKFCAECGTPLTAPSPALLAAPSSSPLRYPPGYLAEKILTSRSALEGERKQVTVLFADLKGSLELLADRDPEEARQLLDPVLERMMAAMHRSDGTANPCAGDGAEGCSTPWGGSGAARESDGPWCTGADRVPPSHCTEMMPGT
jgi:Double zinc ribbon